MKTTSNDEIARRVEKIYRRVTYTLNRRRRDRSYFAIEAQRDCRRYFLKYAGDAYINEIMIERIEDLKKELGRPAEDSTDMMLHVGMMAVDSRLDEITRCMLEAPVERSTANKAANLAYTLERIADREWWKFLMTLRGIMFPELKPAKLNR